MAKKSNAERKADFVTQSTQKLYVARRVLHIDSVVEQADEDGKLVRSSERRTFTLGEEFDTSLVDPRRLRQLFDGHFLDFTPPVTAHGGAA